MIRKTTKGASERQLIEHVLAVIQDRLSTGKQLGPTSFQDADFIQRRFQEVLDDLALAHDTIADLTSQLYGSEDCPVPDKLANALRCHGTTLQPVRLDVGGIPRTFMVPPQGRDDPAAAARLWRQLRQRYGEAGA
ncbi:hypothetical protein [Nonomuraea sp. NPDC050643]|uniref:hypothetical protein n=1 Tax=Nonomuraea sp. NPDC050643 TaxID=3155660 RepID=UPI0033C1CE1E